MNIPATTIESPSAEASHSDHQPTLSIAEIERAQNLAQRLYRAMEEVIQGRDGTLKLIITALVADGHVLLEDYPGSGKTTLSKTLGRLISYPAPQKHDAPDPLHVYAPFRRIQFTPDLLPGDVLGVTIFDAKSGEFRFIKGPVFSHIVLADEINRTGPKVQASFLECMAEKQVTIDNTTYPLDDLFFVIATQNPLDIAGTYPLPIVQLDRFLFRIPMPYVDAATEVKILEEVDTILHKSREIAPVCTRDEILDARALCKRITIAPALREAIVSLVQETRRSPLLAMGASTRAAVMIQSAVKSWALFSGREYATEDDLKTVAPYVLLHRVKAAQGAPDVRQTISQLVANAIEALIRKTS